MIDETSDLLLAFIRCPFKALLLQRRAPIQTSEFHRLSNGQQSAYAKKGLDGLIDRIDPAHVLREPTSLSRSIRRNHRLIVGAMHEIAGHKITLPPIEISYSDNDDSRSLTPIFFSNSSKVREGDKLAACVFSLLIADQVSQSVDRLKTIHGEEFKVRHVALRGKNGPTLIATEARHVLDAFLKFMREDAPPPILQLNRHCDICEFRQRCRDEAVQKDDLSLLSGLSLPEIAQWRARGIFTTTQLAHTFQPKRYCRPNHDPKQHSQSLQALAVQQQTVFIRKTPTLPTAAVRIYLDVEGVPDDNLYYLIGMIREDLGGHTVRQFWSGSDESEMWEAFTNEVEALPDEFSVFHYGSYERKFLETMLDRHGTCGSKRIERLTERLCDVYDAIRTNIFFPAYSNRLKDIARSLGFCWAGPITTGIESIAWRKEWESTGHDRYKDKLIRYNRDDCEALKEVVQYLRSLRDDERESPLIVKQATELDPPSNYGFGRSSDAIPELEGIKKRAYFDYQRDRIFVRTNRSVRRSIQRRTKKNRTFRVNKRVKCEAPSICPTCGQNEIKPYQSSSERRIVKDVRFTTTGVKRWLTEFTTQRWLCKRCLSSFYSPEYPTGGPQYGHGISSWVVHQQVANRQSQQSVVDNLNDLFSFDFSRGIAQHPMQNLASDYAETEATLISALRQGRAICADETKVKVRGGTGYVWAFSGIEEVVYRFTKTRDATILEEVLDGFQGVIVSDFYGGYDSTPCQQQKCLVHLIRDINDDLLKAPFNEELKTLAKRFTQLLKAIVDDIDKFGLKRRHLNKFVKPAARFQDWVLTQEFRTKPAQKYQKRVRKYGNRLFTFLHHDGVPWNNNIAENAIKLVVSRRRFFGASYSKDGMRDYLRFLSFYQTLRRKGGSLLRFLLSKEKDLLKFLGE